MNTMMYGADDHDRTWKVLMMEETNRKRSEELNVSMHCLMQRMSCECSRVGPSQFVIEILAHFLKCRRADFRKANLSKLLLGECPCNNRHFLFAFSKFVMCQGALIVPHNLRPSLPAFRAHNTASQTYGR